MTGYILIAVLFNGTVDSKIYATDQECQKEAIIKIESVGLAHIKYINCSKVYPIENPEAQKTGM